MLPLKNRKEDHVEITLDLSPLVCKCFLCLEKLWKQYSAPSSLTILHHWILTINTNKRSEMKQGGSSGVCEMRQAPRGLAALACLAT